MFKLSKIADYGALILRCLATADNVQLSAREIAAKINVGLPTVSKILKLLVAHQLVNSHRGSHGGYQLACSPDQISMINLISALQGEVAMTQCSSATQNCVLDSHCRHKDNWQVVNELLVNMLSNLTLADMVGNLNPSILLEKMKRSYTL